MIVSKEGLGAINFEHSWGDGVAILRLFNEIYKDSTERPFCHPGDEKHSSEIAANDTDESVFLVGKI